MEVFVSIFVSLVECRSLLNKEDMLLLRMDWSVDADFSHDTSPEK
jgi:hypothetical protein